MSSQTVYQHKKFAVKVEDYSHKKFGKHEELEVKENVSPITVQTILDLTNLEIKQTEQPLPKRKQTKALFRPWLEDSDKKVETTSTPLNVINNNIRPQQPQLHNTKLEQQKRKRNHLAPYNHQHKQLAQQLHLQQLQQYNAYQYYQAAVMQQNVAQALYLRHLQQLSLQRQGQLFVFGQQ
ncbi:uncharacterized protein LOC119601824 [Lucilia sericata]|uniref:uncharacterized protein LOC119601824 n=1 Tax=Lucilia sericata TaxID=13632 RepID=UPI0018A86642|nr:uncharacterized protein LOC119601824 [Lucilia sericata]